MILKWPAYLEDKIYEIRFESGKVSKIVTYFPLTKNEQEEASCVVGENSFNEFYSIFSDTISDEEWQNTREQIKKKFQDELFDIDKRS